jgi:hypothetical protein
VGLSLSADIHLNVLNHSYASYVPLSAFSQLQWRWALNDSVARGYVGPVVGADVKGVSSDAFIQQLHQISRRQAGVLLRGEDPVAREPGLACLAAGGRATQTPPSINMILSTVRNRGFNPRSGQRNTPRHADVFKSGLEIGFKPLWLILCTENP